MSTEVIKYTPPCNRPGNPAFHPNNKPKKTKPNLAKYDEAGMRFLQEAARDKDGLLPTPRQALEHATRNRSVYRSHEEEGVE